MGRSLLLALPLLGVILQTINSAGAASPPPVDLRMQPRISFAPADWHLVLIIERHQDNRATCVTAMDGEFPMRRSCWEIEGAEHPRTTDLWWRGIPAGDYVIVAQVFQTRNRQRQVRTTAQVLGRDQRTESSPRAVSGISRIPNTSSGSRGPNARWAGGR